MRDLSGDALTKIAQQYGNEPIVILDIAWSSGTKKHYADRNVSSIKGKILSISDLDNVIKVSQSDDSQEITVVLDDTNGEIKEIMDENDIHKRDVWVYQYFDGMNLSDKFLLFKGEINSPISWNEGDRTVTITIVSQLEDKEVGFSPEEGQFPNIPKDLIGKTWPSIFGTPLDVPAVQIGKAVTGTTLCSVGIVSGQAQHAAENIGSPPPDICMAVHRRNYVYILSQIFSSAAVVSGLRNPDLSAKYETISEDYLEQGNDINGQINESITQHAAQQACSEAKRTQTSDDAASRGTGCNPVRILGGEDFPRGTITLEINGGLFTGYFEGATDSFKITSRTHPDHEAEIAQALEDRNNSPRSCGAPSPRSQHVIWKTKVPAGHGNNPKVHASTIYKEEFMCLPRARITRDPINQIMRHFWSDAGAPVVIHGNEPITYIVSIVPGTVLQVKAFKTFNGIKRLVNVPTSMWTTESKKYGSVTAVQVTIVKALSTFEDQNWSDDIYVTFESDVGPNTVDIVRYLIETYTDLQIDNTSFNAVKTKIAKFPANFALLDRVNILSLLNDIAFQARCNLRLVNGIFYLTYLAEEPSTVDTITLSDIENQSIEVFLTSTEDLVTKYTALWRLSYVQDDLNKIILRHNVKKYGIQAEEYDYFLYNQPDIIHKIATFWLIRKSNTWKRIRFKTFFQKLNLETFDPVLLNFGGEKYVADSNVKAIIEQANINGEDYTISMECWLPVKSGEMAPYEFAWPANVSATWIFPTDREVDLGLDGGNGIGRNATGNLPVGDVSGVGDQTIFVGGVNVIFGPQTDRGDKYPSDQGFTAQSLRIDSTLAGVTVVERPLLNLLMNYAEYVDPIELNISDPVTFEIILEDTPVVSKYIKNKVGTLSDVLGLDGENSELVIRTAAKFRGTDGASGCQTAPYHFKYDSVGSIWGAGTAFLREDASMVPTPPTSEESDECEPSA